MNFVGGKKLKKQLCGWKLSNRTKQQSLLKFNRGDSEEEKNNSLIITQKHRGGVQQHIWFEVNLQ